MKIFLIVLLHFETPICDIKDWHGICKNAV